MNRLWDLHWSNIHLRCDFKTKCVWLKWFYLQLISQCQEKQKSETVDLDIYMNEKNEWINKNQSCQVVSKVDRRGAPKNGQVLVPSKMVMFYKDLRFFHSANFVGRSFWIFPNFSDRVWSKWYSKECEIESWVRNQLYKWLNIYPFCYLVIWLVDFPSHQQLAKLYSKLSVELSDGILSDLVVMHFWTIPPSSFAWFHTTENF